MILGPHSITVQRAGTRQADYGSGTELDWANTTSTAVDGCSVQPSPADDYTIDRDTFITRLVVYAPPTIIVRATDRIVWNGTTYDIDGDVLRWDFGDLSHVVLNLRRSEG